MLKNLIAKFLLLKLSVLSFALNRKRFRGFRAVFGGCFITVLLLAAGCSSDSGSQESVTASQDSAPSTQAVAPTTATTQAAVAGTSVRLLTHDSFTLSDGVLEAFEAETGIDVEVVQGADTGTVVSQIILTKDNPVADVVFGVDNTFLQRTLDEGIFVPYESPALANVPPALAAGLGGQVTPIDYGDVCVNYWKDELGETLPESMDDLTDEKFRGQFVTQNPESSSPGLAFMLATIARYGEDGWEDYWQRLRDNDVSVTSGWTEAYYTEFTAGGGDRPIVTSYASSPVAEVIFGDPKPDEPPTGIIEDTCFRQVEYAGILDGTDNLAGSQMLIDFMLSDAFQEDIPLNMFVFPATTTADLPADFVEHAIVPETPLSLPAARIAEMRNQWTDRWVEIVLR